MSLSQGRGFRPANLTYVTNRNVERADEDDLKYFSLLESVQQSTYGFYMYGFVPVWISDTEIFYRDTLISEYAIKNFETDEVIELAPTSSLPGLSVTTTTLSPTRKYLLGLSTRNDDNLVRCRLFDLESRTVINVDDDNYIQVCKWLRDGKEDELMFIKHNNVYIRKENGEVIQVTTNGQKDVIINGGTSDASFYTSPEATKFAFTTSYYYYVNTFKFDTFDEPGEIDNQYPDIITLRYAKPGHKIRHTDINIIDLATGVKQAVFSAPEDTLGSDCNIAEIEWLSDTNIIIVWFNRRQNIASFQNCNVETATCVEILKLENPEGWVDYPYVVCHYKAEKCFYYFDVDNWRNIFSIGSNGNPVAVTTGEKTVESILNYDAENDIM